MVCENLPSTNGLFADVGDREPPSQVRRVRGLLYEELRSVRQKTHRMNPLHTICIPFDCQSRKPKSCIHIHQSQPTSCAALRVDKQLVLDDPAVTQLLAQAQPKLSFCVSVPPSKSEVRHKSDHLTPIKSRVLRRQLYILNFHTLSHMTTLLANKQEGSLAWNQTSAESTGELNASKDTDQENHSVAGSNMACRLRWCILTFRNCNPSTPCISRYQKRTDSWPPATCLTRPCPRNSTSIARNSSAWSNGDMFAANLTRSSYLDLL